jgi:acylphosphatase
VTRVCYRCVVAGRVQGVFFRSSTQHQAQLLGVSGWARNLADGRVEVVACGAAGDIDMLREWLWTGPPSARVQDVRCEAVTLVVGEGFSVR